MTMNRKPKSGRRVNQKGRSEGEQYAVVTYAMLHSAAWRSLSGAAVKVFLELRTRFYGGNNGRLILSLEEASRLLGLGKGTVHRALGELQDKGLVIRTKKGHWYGRQASTWAVVDKPIEGMGAVQGWKTWQPPPPKAKPQKTKHGARMDPSVVAMGAEMDREHSHGSATAPVRPLRLVAIGAGMDR
jgi:IclR helix-turn-helix domain